MRLCPSFPFKSSCYFYIMRSTKIEAIVIKRRDFQEKDRVLTLFSRQEGKFDAISKGSRRPGSRFSYFSDMGSIGQFYLYRSNLIPIITDYKTVFAPEEAREDFKKTEKLGFAFKLIDKLYRENDPHPRTYDILKYTAARISSGDYQMLFLVFLLNVVGDLGLKPRFDSCANCSKELCDGGEFCFNFDGGVCHKDCVEGNFPSVTEDEIKLLRLIYKKPYNEISTAKVKADTFNQLYKLIVEYFNWHFGKILPDKIL